MFANNNLGVLNFGFPDVCLVPAGPVPVPTPFPNLAFSSTHIPSVFTSSSAAGWPRACSPPAPSAWATRPAC